MITGYENFMMDMIESNSPKFIFRWNFPDSKLRAYQHKSGFKEVYNGLSTESSKHLLEVFEEVIKPKNPNYILATVWGKEKDKMIDFALYFDIVNNEDKWMISNPDILVIVTKNGMVDFNQKLTTCEDTIIILGEEAKYRRTTKNLSDYLENPPNLCGVGLRTLK